MIATGAQEERTVELNMDDFTKRLAEIVHNHVTEAIKPMLTRLAEVEKSQAAAQGKSVHNRESRVSEFKLPKADDGDGKTGTVSKTGFALPKAED
ncbi:hypothetical protein DY251_07750 [Mesorhizobium denitrificans]|uniref:Uncharacterized protein n=2 Tax=Phyllobacteriaceae TaxID=69277 RepID=A0A371XG12_9HYPH|nr:hypothetical protein DY251_07750 [Mesorhizobium denitrificans]